MATVMNSHPTQPPHRKPVPAQRAFNNLPAHAQQPHQPSPSQYNPNYPRPRDSSNSPPIYGGQAQQQQQRQFVQSNGHAFSASTSSTYTNNIHSGLSRAPTNSSMPRRSTSSRSNGSSGSPTSYVALMRKQKATVWCDRAQHEDPTIIARQRLLRQKAAVEVAGGKYHGNRASTSSSGPGGSVGIRSKIRHQGAPKAGRYAGGANMSGAGVPIRLSATEVDDNDSDEDLDSKYAKYNQRTGSGRSSTGSGQRTSSNLNNGRTQSNDSTPPTGPSPDDSVGNVHEEHTPMPKQTNLNQGDYFPQLDEEDAEEEEKFGGIGRLPPSKPKTEKDIKTEEELRRRGSVDDRAMTMSGQRLFVANPDLSD